MVIPCPGQVLEIDFKSKLTSGIQGHSSGSEYGMRALLNSFSIVVCESHCEIDLANRLVRYVRQQARNIADANGSREGVAGRNAQVRELNGMLDCGGIRNFGKVRGLIRTATGAETPDEKQREDKNYNATRDKG
jgi:hypothetical protein